MADVTARGFTIKVTAHPTEDVPGYGGFRINLGDIFHQVGVPPVGSGPAPVWDMTPMAEAMLEGLLDAGYTASLSRRETMTDDPYVPDESP